MNSKKIAEAVKKHLISLAAKDKLPMDMNDLSLKDLEKVIKSAMPTYKEKAIEMAGNYLSDGDLTTLQMIEAIAKHKDQKDLIDSVDGVVVWQKVEYAFTCEDFLQEIGWDLF